MAQLSRMLGLLIGLGLVPFITTTTWSQAIDPLRPSIAAACSAWREHISQLIDQHRIADDMDDEDLSVIVLQFISARNACSLGSEQVGLRMYEAILIGRVSGFLK